MRPTNKQIFFMVISILVFVISSHSHAFQNEPDSFGEYKWGSKIDDFRTMIPIVGDTDVEGFLKLHKEIKAYSQASDQLYIEKTPITLIAYYFYKDKLIGVTLNYETKKNYEQLIKILVSRHGQGTQQNPLYTRLYERQTGIESAIFREMKWWIGKDGYIRIQYNTNRGKGTVEFFYWDVALKDYYGKAVNAYSNKDFKEAKKNLLICAVADGRIAHAAQGKLGFMYEKGLGVDKDCVQAVSWYRLAAEALNLFGLTRLGWMYDIGCGVKQNYREAFELYRQAAELGYAPAQYNVGSMYERGAGVEADISEAESWYRKSAEQGYKIASKNLKDLEDEVAKIPMVCRNAFEYKGSENQTKINLFSECITTNKSSNKVLSDAYFMRGAVYSDLGKFELAIADHTKVIELNPENVDAYSSRGTSNVLSGKIELAIADFTKVIELSPEDDHAYFMRGAVYSDLGRFELAIADFTKVIELSPEDDHAYFMRGVVYSDLAKFELAITDYTRAIELNPQNEPAYNELAWLYATAKDKEHINAREAVKLALKAIELSNNNPAYIDTLAAAYAELGKFDMAVEAQSEAINILEREGKDASELRKVLESYQQGQKHY